MKNRFARVRRAQKDTALERIGILFKQACDAKQAWRARRYVELARKIAKRYRVRIPPPWNRRYCRACSALWVPGINCRVRTREARVVTECLDCGFVARFSFVREKRKRA